MKKLYIGTNTKMYKNREETVSYIEKLRVCLEKMMESLPAEPEFQARQALTVFVIPSFTSLESAGRALLGSRILLGAQNMGWEERGAFTGEISPLMLKELGVSLVELGHSERRHILGETEEQIGKKVSCGLRNDLQVLLCIGETREERENGMADETLQRQIESALKGIENQKASRIMIAYEPVWAIGEMGELPEKGYVERRHQWIRKKLISCFGEEGKEIPILYGGSVNRENAEELAALSEVDGLFIGRSAWDAERFTAIIHSALHIYGKK